MAEERRMQNKARKSLIASRIKKVRRGAARLLLYVVLCAPACHFYCSGGAGSIAWPRCSPLQLWLQQWQRT